MMGPMKKLMRAVVTSVVQRILMMGLMKKPMQVAGPRAGGAEVAGPRAGGAEVDARRSFVALYAPSLRVQMALYGGAFVFGVLAAGRCPRGTELA